MFVGQNQFDKLQELEELEDIRLYDEAMAANEPSIPIHKAFEMIEAKRKSTTSS